MQRCAVPACLRSAVPARPEVQLLDQVTGVAGRVTGVDMDAGKGTPDNQGFVVGEITSSGRVVNLRSVKVPNAKCCFNCRM